MKRILLLLCLFACTAFAKERANVLFIITDDQALETIHALGNNEIRTPNLDELVRSGVSFNHAYNMGAWTDAVCIPSRTMLMSGRMLWNVKDVAKPEYKDPLLIEGIKNSGYELYATGKWHVASAKSYGQIFHHVLGEQPGELALAKEDRAEFTPWNQSYGGYWNNGKHVTDITGDNAISLLAKADEQEKPFLLYVGFNAPHSTWQYDKEKLDTYDPARITVPDSVSASHFFINNTWPKEVTKAFIAERYREIYIMVEQMDQQVGRIIAKLKETGNYEKTIIVFMSDHGLSLGENGVMGKQNLYERSMKAPLIIAGPGILKNKLIEERVYLQDIMPTLMDYLDVPIPDYCQYKSLKALIENPEAPAPWDSIYGAFKENMRSIYKGDHKLVLYARDGEKHARFYNLKNDSLEKIDLSKEQGSVELMKNAFEDLQKWEKKTGSELDLRSVFSID